MLNFGNTSKSGSGTVIENKSLDGTNNQISIQVSDFNYAPNEGGMYLISFRGMNRFNKRSYFSELKNIPDENNILSFDLEQSEQLKSLSPGVQVKIQGPFGQTVEQAG